MPTQNLPRFPDARTALYDLIRQRRSIRRFNGQPITPATLDRVLEAAIWAPSAHNRQPWRFVVLNSAAERQRLAAAMGERLAADLRADGVDEAALEADIRRSFTRMTEAAVVVVVCLSMVDMDTYPDARRQSLEHQMGIQSVAMAAQNLMLAAHAEGLGTCWVCAPLFCPDVVSRTLVLPPDYEPQGAILLGYPAEQRVRGRDPLLTKVIFRS